MGLTAAQFDIAVLLLIAAAALAVWLFVFDGTTTARDYFGLEKSPPVGVSRQPASQPAVQPAADAAAAPVAAEQPPPEAAPAADPTLNDFLAASAQALNEVQSFRGRFQMTISMNGESQDSGGDMLFQAPDKMHMTMNVDGQTFEMLAILPNMYLRVPNKGWYVLGGSAMGFSADALNGYINNRGLFDYEAEAQMLGELAQVPDEEIDGVPYLHFQGTLSFQQLVDALPPDFYDPSQIAAVAEVVSGPVQVDVLLDKETTLPRRYTMTIELDANGTPVSIDVRMAFTEFNGSVTIPDAPEDARPFDSLAADFPTPQID